VARQRTLDGGLFNFIGDRGENLFELAITDYSQFRRPLFRPAFLGGKWPAVDYLVELTGVRGMTPFFFAQVKSTAAPIVGGEVHVTLPPGKRRALARLPGPTYLVGVQEPLERAFIRAVNDQAGPGLYAISVANELTPDNLRVLYDEVKAFWRQQEFKPHNSAFA
jgi:hypothetical protein